jgi:hypothetical protein
VLAKIPLYFDEEAQLPGIGVVISTHESVSYAIGYRRGRRGILIKCPWWADMIAYGVAQMDGHRAYIGEHDERPAHVEPVEGPSTIQEVGNQQDLAADGTADPREARGADLLPCTFNLFGKPCWFDLFRSEKNEERHL